MVFRQSTFKDILMNFVIALTAGFWEPELPLRLLNVCLARVPVTMA